MNKDKKEKDKSITLVVSVKKQIEAIDIKIANINKNLDTIFDNYEIKEYTFSFELINDDYYLVKIIQEKNHS